MTLRRKAFLIVAVTLISLIGILYTVSRVVFIEGLLEVERHDTRQHVEQALATLSYTLSQLEAATVDWAAWDDTYDFIESENNEYIQSNLIDDTFVTSRLNLMLFIHSSGRVVFSKAFDLQDEEEVPISAGLRKYLSTGSLSLSSPDTGRSASGFILLDEGPMYIVSQPILTSNTEGPSRGILVFGRYLDSVEIGRLSQITLFPISIHPVSATQMPADFQSALPSLSEEKPIFVQPLDEERIAGYTLIRDILGRPSLVMRVDISRDIYRAGLNTVYAYVLSAVAVSVVVAVVALFIVETQVLSRFTRLVRDINKVTTSRSPSERLSATSSDELGIIATTINGMLAALQQSESELKDSESHYRLLAENITDIIFTVDWNKGLTYISPSITPLTGYSVEEAIALPLEVAFASTTLDTARGVFTEEMALESLEDKDLSRVRSLELEVRCKDGSTVWVEARASFMHDTNGKAVGILGIARDIAERRRADEELRELYQHEKDLRQELEAEIARRIEFTRALVHELKTPLTPVVASSELLLEETKDKLLTKLAQNIYNGALNLSNRIDELLDLAKSEIGTLEVNIQLVEPIQLLNEVVDSVMPLAQRYGQTLNVEFPPSLPTILADATRTKQVVLNLINNAFKFSPAEGKTTVRARVEKKELVVEVQDTGRGISQEEQQRIFEPYHQAESDRGRLSGLGLGLSLSKKLVELQGGQIWMKSRVGEGSTFSFSIPLASASDRRKLKTEMEL